VRAVQPTRSHSRREPGRNRNVALLPVQGAVLLEVILALVLFVAAAAVVTAGINASLDSVERQRYRAHALDLAVSVISELQAGIRSPTSAGPEDFPAPFRDWTWELQTAALETEPGETAALTRVEVIIRSKSMPVVQRLAQVVRLGAAKPARKESDVGRGL
jgi:hypothetical protein